jgi:hydrogenase maturation protease
VSTPGPETAPRPFLVAGIGNIFLSDDGFGVETVRRLATRGLPDDVELVDSGVRGVHLAFKLLDGHRTVVLIDAVKRGAPPGTVHLIEADISGTQPRETLVDAHHMTPDAVLALLDTLCVGTGGGRPGRVLVVGCEPACLDEGIGLSEPVAAAVDEAIDLVLRILRDDTREPGNDNEGAHDHVEDHPPRDGDGRALRPHRDEPVRHQAVHEDALHVTADRATPAPGDGVAGSPGPRPAPVMDSRPS